MSSIANVFLEKINKENAILVLKKCYKDFLKLKIDVSDAIILGAGSNGTAFKLKNGLVLKITDRENEFLTALKIKGKKLKHIFQPLKVGKLSDKEFFILKEILVEVSEEEYELWDENMWMFEFPYDSVLSFKGSADLKKSVLKCLKVDNQNYPGSNTFEESWKWIQFFQIDLMANELHSAGLDISDIDIHNIMKKGSDFVLIETDM